MDHKQEQILSFYWDRLKQFAKFLSLPAFLASSLLMGYSAYQYAHDPMIVREMPVIIVYCNELDLSKKERREVMKDPDQVIVRCQERTNWPGDDRQAIRGLVKQKADDIINSLFSNVANQNIVRIEVVKPISYFPEGSMALFEYKKIAETAVAIAEKEPTSFKIKNSYLRHVKKKNDGESWVAMYSGIWIEGARGSDAQTGKRVTAYIVFSPVFGENRNNNEQAVMVREFEVQIDE